MPQSIDRAPSVILPVLGSGWWGQFPGAVRPGQTWRKASPAPRRCGNYADPRRAGEKKRTQPSTQDKGWYGRAILAAMIVRTQRPDVRAVIAFPDFPRYRGLYHLTADQLQKCNIELWWITEEGEVTVAARA